MGMRFNELLAEGIGAFALVLAGCGAIVVDALSGGAIGHVGVSAVFGLIVLAMIYSVGNISGAHLNPAVTLGFALAGRLKWSTAPLYMLAQIVGALAAAGLLRLAFPASPTLGQTTPAEWASSIQAAGAEVALTFVLMFVILNVSTGHMEKGIMAGVAVGGTIALAALAGGPVSGASLNPARSIGPAVVAGDVSALWIYLAGPCVGAALASPLCRWVQGSQCCLTEPAAEPTSGGPSESIPG